LRIRIIAQKSACEGTYLQQGRYVLSEVEGNSLQCPESAAYGPALSDSNKPPALQLPLPDLCMHSSHDHNRQMSPFSLDAREQLDPIHPWQPHIFKTRSAFLMHPFKKSSAEVKPCTRISL
jgi:hypothetical protein